MNRFIDEYWPASRFQFMENVATVNDTDNVIVNADWETDETLVFYTEN